MSTPAALSASMHLFPCLLLYIHALTFMGLDQAVQAQVTTVKHYKHFCILCQSLFVLLIGWMAGQIQRRSINVNLT